jgi:hypothetical protein
MNTVYIPAMAGELTIPSPLMAPAQNINHGGA